MNALFEKTILPPFEDGDIRAARLPSPPVLRGRGVGGEGAEPAENVAPPHGTTNPLTPALSPGVPGEREKCQAKTAREPLPKGDRNLNPPGLSLWVLWREDLRTHDGNPFEQGFWAVAVHRFGNWRMSLRWKIARAPMTLLYLFLFKFVEWTCGITLPYTVRLGRRVRLWHHSGMILHARSIGDDVHIRHNTTFGVARRDENEAIPIIGARVDLGCGVSILGAVTVGDDSVVGAHAVVLDSIPPGGVAVGIPAKVIKVMAPRSTRS